MRNNTDNGIEQVAFMPLFKTNMEDTVGLGRSSLYKMYLTQYNSCYIL